MSPATVYKKEANFDLIEHCRQGKNSAFKEVYDLYSRAMFNICMRMLNNRDEAEDVLQESFISAFKNIKQYTGEASFGSWLKRIVINRCIDAVKKRSLHLVPLDDMDQAQEEAYEEDPDADVYTVESVKNGISQLPDGYRIILTLYLFENYSHRMIAEKLGISEGTSKSQYSRARKKLAELMNVKKKNDA